MTEEVSEVMQLDEDNSSYNEREEKDTVLRKGNEGATTAIGRLAIIGNVTEAHEALPTA